MPPNSHRLGPALVALLLAAPAGTSHAQTVPQTASQTVTARVIVNAAAMGRTIPATAIGVNTAVWQSGMTGPDIPGRMRAAGVAVLRYPGGSTSDVYDWRTHTDTERHRPFGAASDFDAFMALCRKSGAAPIITVNYGSDAAGAAGGDPASAAAWVHQANVVKHYGVKYWEIGNEIYGNGEYGAHWEKDLHADHSPAAYGKNCEAFIRAMKAEDPTIKVGVVVTAPGNWPYGQTPDWNATVLGACGADADFVIPHWYPQNQGRESDAGLLASTGQIPGMMATLRREIARYCGANAPRVQVMLTETNSVNTDPGKQSVGIVDALFLADDVLGWLENGAANVDWWALLNGATSNPNNSPALYGAATFGDYGLLATGGGPEPRHGTPFPAYYALQLLGRLDRPGGRFVAAASSAPLLTVHAVRQTNGDLAVLLVNKDPRAACAATVSIAGYRPTGRATEFSYGTDSAAVTQEASAPVAARFTRTVPPYSLLAIVMTPKR